MANEAGGHASMCTLGPGAQCWRSPRPRPDLAAGAPAITVARATASGRGRDRASLPLLDAGAVAGPGLTRRAGLALARGAVRGAAGTGPLVTAQVTVAAWCAGRLAGRRVRSS